MDIFLWKYNNLIFWGISFLEFKVITPGVSLGVLSPQGRHSATYNEHMPMKELHTVMQPACQGKFPYRPLQKGSDAALMFHLQSTL